MARDSRYVSACLGSLKVASAVAIVMLLLLIVPITIFHRFQAREMEKYLA